MMEHEIVQVAPAPEGWVALWKIEDHPYLGFCKEPIVASVVVKTTLGDKVSYAASLAYANLDEEIGRVGELVPVAFGYNGDAFFSAVDWVGPESDVESFLRAAEHGLTRNFMQDYRRYVRVSSGASPSTEVADL